MKETKKDATPVITSYTYDKNDRLITETKGGLTTTYTYDANGNQLTKTTSGSQTSQTQKFDALNRMTSYNDGITNVSYTYYPDNLRKSKTSGNVTTTHVWLEGEIALDMTTNNVVNYIRGEKLIVSDYGWYHYNAHEDVMQLSDDNGDVTRNYDYDSYGNIINATSASDDNPYRYCGGYYDSCSGYVYMQNRYYDTSTGRFISQDPINQGNNWYIYCDNDPVNYIDPSGLARLSRETRDIFKEELNAMTKKGFKKGSRQFKDILKLALKHRDNWRKAYSDKDSMLEGIGNSRAGTAQLLARMLYGEGTARENRYPEKEYRYEILGFWNVVNNTRKARKTTVRKELLRTSRYCGLTGSSSGQHVAPGWAPAICKRWCRAVIVGTMYEKKKTSKLRKAPGITSDVKYWHMESQWEELTTPDRKKIRFEGDRTKTYYKVTAKVQYASTVFYGYDPRSGRR